MASRRQRGSGSIRKLGKALYLRYRPPGQARQVETAFPRLAGETMPAYRKRAEAELANITLGLAAGTRSAPTPRTVDELAESLLASVRPSVKARTYEGYERHLSLYVLPLVGKVKVASLSTADIRRVQRQLLERKVAGGTMAISTAREAMARLHDMVRHAMDGADSREYWGITFDPWPLRGLKWPDNRERPAPRTYAPYSVDEARQYIQAAPEHLLPHVLSVVLLMLRDGEFRAMKWTNLDWDEGLYYVRETQSRVHGFTSTKTEASEAPVPVPRVLLDALSAHRKRQAESKLLKGGGWQDQDLIFTTSKGTPLPHWQMSSRWHPAIVKTAGLRHVSLHTLRKTGASILEGMGVSRSETMEALRHKRGTVTDRYVGIDMEQRRQHIEELARLLTSDAQASKSATSGIG